MGGFPRPGTGLPSGGTTGQAVAKASNANFDFTFVTIPTAASGLIPSGGASGQVLAKTAGTDFTVAWVTITPPLIIRVVPIAFVTPMTPNADTTDIVNVGTLTAPITMSPPSGTPVDGQKLTFRFTQDGTGRAITMSSAAGGFLFGTDITAAMMPTTAAAKFELNCEWNATDGKWRVVGIARGF